MSEIVIFYFGIAVTSLLVLGVLFTIYEFRKMGKSPEKYMFKSTSQDEPKIET